MPENKTELRGESEGFEQPWQSGSVSLTAWWMEVAFGWLWQGHGGESGRELTAGGKAQRWLLFVFALMPHAFRLIF